MEGIMNSVLKLLSNTNGSSGLDDMDYLQQLKDQQFRTRFKSWNLMEFLEAYNATHVNAIQKYSFRIERFLLQSSRSYIKWGASSWWSSSVYCPICNSDEMTTGKMHPTVHFSNSGGVFQKSTRSLRDMILSFT